jgi:predicted nucleic acid-binding protein
MLTAATAPLREPPLTHEIVLIAQQLPLPQRDPADRFLAATAQLMDLKLVTADGTGGEGDLFPAEYFWCSRIFCAFACGFR